MAVLLAARHGPGQLHYRPRPAGHGAGGLVGGASPGRAFAGPPPGAEAATDGSGGGIVDPRLRRAGWGFTVADLDGNEVIYASGGTPGKQTVPRAELFVLLQLACHTTGELLVHISTPST